MEMSENGDLLAIEHMLKQASNAYVARDWDGFTSFFTEDAVWLPPDQPPLIGKTAWWAWMGGGWAQSTVERMDSISEEIVLAGDWAFEWHNEIQAGPGWQMSFKGIFILQRDLKPLN